MAVNADAVLVLIAHWQGLRRSRGGGLCAVTLIQFPRFVGEEMEVWLVKNLLRVINQVNRQS